MHVPHLVFSIIFKFTETDGYNVTYLVADGGQNETVDNVNIIALPKAKIDCSGSL